MVYMVIDLFKRTALVAMLKNAQIYTFYFKKAKIFHKIIAINDKT